MPEVNPLSSRLSGAQIVEFDRIVQRFEDAWLRGERPVLEVHLPEERELRHAVLGELVRMEIECRRKVSEDAPVEEYLIRFPELAADQQTIDVLQSGIAGKSVSRHEEQTYLALSAADQALFSILDGLPEQDRLVLQLRHRDQLPYVEIGRRLNCSLEAARELWWQAFQKFQNVYVATEES